MTNPFVQEPKDTTSSSPGKLAKRRRGAAIIAAVSAACLGLAVAMFFAGGGNLGSVGPPTEAASGPAAAVTPTGETTEVSVTVEGMSFVPGTIDVPVGNRLVVTFENTGDQRHDLRFANGTATQPLAPGDSQVVDVGIIGTDMQGWCTLPGHRQMGMELEVVALGATGSDTAAPGSAQSGGTHTMPGVPSRPVPTMDQLIAEAKGADTHPAELPPLTEQTIHEYTFVVTEDQRALAEGVVRPIWTFNGTSPGPTLHGRIGDRFKITLENQGTMGHSIDFHAGIVAPDEPMRTIEPGESLVYEFEAPRSGIWMYHCSTMPMSLHIANGMFGAVIIEPDELPEVDHSFVLVQSDVYLNSDPASGSTLPDLVAFNGTPFQYSAHPLTVRVGERVRIWLLDVGPNAPLSFHVVGTQFDTVWSEGRYSVYRDASTDGITKGATGAQVLALMAAEGGFVEFVPQEAGTYTFVNHIMSLAEKGAHGRIVVTD